jgi:sterol desaturase/sphingolipid hydroxylase (fatty acid hydroxylase superfamily)
MDVILPTAAIYLGLNVLGIIWTLAIVRFGLPDSIRLQDRPHLFSTFKERLPLVVFNVTVLLCLSMWAIYSMDSAFVDGPIPIGLLCLQVMLVLVVDDAVFYIWHRVLHENKWLYNTVHRIHHKAFSPLPFEYIYVHPVEWIVGSIGPFLGLISVYMVWGELPSWTLWAYLIVRNLHEMDIHSGIRSFIGPYIPLFGLTEHHDLHHAKPTKGNYSSTFTLWDRVFKTLWRPAEPSDC